MTTIGKRIVRVAVAIGTSATLMASLASTANATVATARNGICEDGEFCLYWGTGRNGSLSDFTTSISNYGNSQPTCYEFISRGNGQRQCVKNNATSAWNRRSTITRVNGSDGSAEFLTAKSRKNLTITSSNNGGHLLTCPRLGSGSGLVVTPVLWFSNPEAWARSTRTT